MINKFLYDKIQTQESMTADLPPERLLRLAARASVADAYLAFALEKPEDEETVT